VTPIPVKKALVEFGQFPTARDDLGRLARLPCLTYQSVSQASLAIATRSLSPRWSIGRSPPNLVFGA